MEPTEVEDELAAVEGVLEVEPSARLAQVDGLGAAVGVGEPDLARRAVRDIGARQP